MGIVKAVPEGYHSLQPYLHVRGAAQAIEFHKRAFGATEIKRFPQPDGRLGHAELRMGDSVMMLAGDFPERGIRSPADLGGSAVSLMFYTEDCDAVYRRAIAAGAKNLREPADQFCGGRSAGVEDPFGFQWWIATHIRDMSTDEMKKAATEQRTA
jgi:PhnB protein